MMKIEDIKSVFFNGIGGIGMSALAQHFQNAGIKVYGYDRQESHITKKLSEQGAQIIYSDDPENIPQEVDLVVFTPAIPQSQSIFSFHRAGRNPLQKRSEVLEWLTTSGNCFAFAGTHGKTTMTAIFSHIMRQSQRACTSFVGGWMLNYDSNYISGGPSSSCFAVEADEYDRSFHRLRPRYAVISAMDSDHLDIYGSRGKLVEAFQHFGELSENLLVHSSLAKRYSWSSQTLTYSLEDESADFHTKNRRISNGRFAFDIVLKGTTIANVSMKHPAWHNVENALAASALCEMVGVKEAELRHGLETFSGIYRRFEILFQDSHRVYIDDYAHHPKEIEAVLATVREMYPKRRITAVFQPHLYSRTRDLASDFATVLGKADKVFLLPIYPAREEPIRGVSSALIAREMEQAELVEKTELSQWIKGSEEVLLTLGAGNIEDLREAVIKRFCDEKEK